MSQHGNEGPEHDKKPHAVPENAGSQDKRLPSKGFRLPTGDACITTGVCGWAWSSCLRR